MYGINSLGAEWRIDLEVGKKQRYSTEFYPYIVPIVSLGNQELRSQGYGGGLAFGVNLSRSFRTEVSMDSYRDQSQVDAFSYKEDFKSKQVNLKFLYDSLDNYNFPSKGWLGQLKLKKDSKAWDSDYDYEQIYALLQKPFTLYNNTLILNVKYGKTNIITPFPNGTITVYDKFYLGGMFNLSGIVRYAFICRNYS